jgi:tetraacyldisaccharide 4'-kinase
MHTPDFWQHDNFLSKLLAPAAWVYGLGAALDQRFTIPRHAPVPVISVGNVTAGGTGKTPTALALAAMLQAMGETPHIVTRGYGGRQKSPHRVQENDDWRHVGDEALLLAAAAPTWVSRDRFAAAHAAAKAGATLVICDDALQHHRLHKDISLLVVNAAYGLGNGRIMPAGPLRERWSVRLKNRIDAVVVIGDGDVPALGSLQPIYRAQLQVSGDANTLKTGRFLAFAGIAHPAKFFATLQTHGAMLAATRRFPDHHPYSREELLQLIDAAYKLQARPITTTKDAVKIPTDLRAQVDVLPVKLAFGDIATLQHYLCEKLATARRAD